MKVKEINQVRSEYTSARLIFTNLQQRRQHRKMVRYSGYHPAETDYKTMAGQFHTIKVRDYDVRYLDRVPVEKALAHINLIHQARNGNSEAIDRLEHISRNLYTKISSRFLDAGLTENDYVIPYTSDGHFSEFLIGNKGAGLLDLFRRGFATPDFNLLSSKTYELSAGERKKWAGEAIYNLEKLSGRKLGDADHPLLIAVRSALPFYIPGFMPTYLNVGLTPDMLSGLPGRYGKEAGTRIWLNNRKTILEALDPQLYGQMEHKLDPHLSPAQNSQLASEIEDIIVKRNPELLTDPLAQILFFLAKAYEYYENHLDILGNFMGHERFYPAIILQRMVCSVLDKNSYAGVLYSRHPRTGIGPHLQFARTIYGEELMTGRLPPDTVDLVQPEYVKDHFPAVYHFLSRLHQLEEIFRAPVMVEFTGVHGTFTLLQVNQAELSGTGMLVAVLNLYRDGKFTAQRVRELIQPYHIRQIESDAINPASLQKLTPFTRGFSVLPRSAVSGRLYFCGQAARLARDQCRAENVILIKERFTPTDTIHMQYVQGIASLNPAAIHVVTTTQNLGIPALLNLEQHGIFLDQAHRLIRNKEGQILKEGDWVTISSRNKTLYVGKAMFAPARLLRYMAGEKVELSDAEREKFDQLVAYYHQYRDILEDVEAAEFKSMQDLGHAIRYGKLRQDKDKARTFVNRCFDHNVEILVERLLDATLGTHLTNNTSFELLSMDRKITLFKSLLKICRQKGLSGYQAGAFLIGSFVRPEFSPSFWESFQSDEIAMLISEWLLHQKYLHILTDVGEQRISRAKDFLLTHGLSNLYLYKGLIARFITLKLSQVDLGQVSGAIFNLCDPQTKELIEILQKPYSFFYDFSKPWSLEPLKEWCRKEDLPLPSADDC